MFSEERGVARGEGCAVRMRSQKWRVRFRRIFLFDGRKMALYILVGPSRDCGFSSAF